MRSGSGEFSPDDPGRFFEIDRATHCVIFDHYMVSAGFRCLFSKPQRGIDARAGRFVPAWDAGLYPQRPPRNARWFSSDRTIREYAQEIWNVPGARDLCRARLAGGRAAQRGGNPLTGEPEIHYLRRHRIRQNCRDNCEQKSQSVICEERSDEAIQFSVCGPMELLRGARHRARIRATR